MALLTVEDVLNKAFSKTKYREGFDQDEVDDFLDEVAHTIAGLTEERDALQVKLDAATAELSARPANGSPYSSTPVSYPAATEALATPVAEISQPFAPRFDLGAEAGAGTPAEAPVAAAPVVFGSPDYGIPSFDTPVAEPVAVAPAVEVEAPPVTAFGGVPGTTSLLSAATDPAPQTPTAMLAMAAKLHDEYVQAGEQERDRLISEASDKATKIVKDAEAQASSRLAELNAERAELERVVDDLRRFERDYRSRLKSYLENLLGDLDHGAGKDRAPSTSPTL